MITHKHVLFHLIMECFLIIFFVSDDIFKLSDHLHVSVTLSPSWTTTSLLVCKEFYKSVVVFVTITSTTNTTMFINTLIVIAIMNLYMYSI